VLSFDLRAHASPLSYTYETLNGEQPHTMVMALGESSPEFLGSEEKVISSLGADTWGLFVTNWRLIFITKTKDDKTRTFQDFDYKHISHIYCQSITGNDYKLLGIVSIVLGLIIIAIGISIPSRTPTDYYLILGIIFIIIGIVCILYKPKQKSTFKIELVGISNPNTITLATSASQMDIILKSLAEMREKTTLRHDKLTPMEDASI